MDDRRRFLRIFSVLAAFGGLSALAMLGKPGFESMRAVDAVHLLGTGMCFGAALLALVLFLRSPR
jgi:hypothetical protein